MPNFDSKILRRLMIQTLEGLNVNSDSIEHVVSSVIQTSLRGVDSHGINLFPHYCKVVKSGRVNRNPKMKIVRKAASTILLDADHAFGHHAGAVGIDKAIELAKKTGMGAVGVKNSTHFGAAAYFGLRAADRNFLGFSFTNADALVKVHGAKDLFFGTNPICFTAPLKTEDPFCLDMATSIVSWNKIKNYRAANKSIPLHWAFDEKGRPVENPHDARSLNPIGDYKGFGLGMLVEILCSLISGGPIGKDIGPMFANYNSDKRRIGHFFMAIDISKFIELRTFKKNMQEMVDRVRNLDALNGNRVMVAGDPEKISFKARIKTGIPVDEAKAQEFFDVSNEFKKALMS